MWENQPNLKQILEIQYGMKFTSSGHALCPFHDDTNPSFHVQNENGRWSWRCYGCGKHGNLREFEQLMRKDRLVSNGIASLIRGRIDKTFDYTNESGNLIFQCVRFQPKSFRFRRPVGNADWIWNLTGIELVPYRLPEIIAAEQVVIVEGEKDADNVKEQLGLVATTNPMGADKWRESYNRYLQGKNVVIVPDNDEPGKRHAQEIANSLVGIAREIKIVSLPNMPEKGDISDWLEGGGTLQLFNQLAENSPLYEPEDTEIPNEQIEQPGTLRIVTLRDFLSREIHERDILINPILAKNELGILSGPAKLGKSLLSLNISICLAAGRDWLGFQVRRAVKVLIIQQEVGADALTERLRRMLSIAGMANPDNLLDNIAVNSTRGILLDTEGGFNEVSRAIETYDPEILILDPLITFHTKIENASEQMAIIFRKIHRLIDEHNITVLIVHHFGKPSQLEREGGELHRGSSVIGSASDSNWTFKRIPSNRYRTSGPRNEYAELSFELRNAEAPNPIVLHRDSETLWYEIEALEENRRVTPEMIRDTVHEHGGRVFQRDVIRTMRTFVSPRLIKEAIYEAERRGLIFARLARGRGSPKELFIRDLLR